MYTDVKSVQDMLKPDILNALIGDVYIEEEAERQEKVKPIIAEAIEDAAGEINGYLAKRYAIPIEPIPRVIVKYCKDIAVYNLYSRIGIDENDKEKNFLNRYRSAIKFLEYVAIGKIDLGVEGHTKQNSQNSAKGFQMSSNDRLFTRKSMKGF